MFLIHEFERLAPSTQQRFKWVKKALVGPSVLQQVCWLTRGAVNIQVDTLRKLEAAPVVIFAKHFDVHWLNKTVQYVSPSEWQPPSCAR